MPVFVVPIVYTLTNSRTHQNKGSGTHTVVARKVPHEQIHTPLEDEVPSDTVEQAECEVEVEELRSERRRNQRR